MKMLRAPHGLLLDLDGTLIDSAPDIAAALADVFISYGITPLDVETVRSLIGHGIKKLVADAFHHAGTAPSPDALAQAQAAMMVAYGEMLTVRTTMLPGVETLMENCARQGISLACVTNKPEHMARTILAHFDLLDRFALVIGGDSGFGIKPSPTPLNAAAEKLGLSPSQLWMVGDSLPDMQAAAAAGMAGVAIRSTYGAPVDIERHAMLVLASLNALDRLINRKVALCM